jgi:hypothetical protein
VSARSASNATGVFFIVDMCKAFSFFVSWQRGEGVGITGATRGRW